MDIPIEIFLSFIAFSLATGIIGLWKRIPLMLFIAGGLMTFWAITTDNIIMNERIDNIVATESTFNITGSITQIPDYSYNVITGNNLLTIRADGANTHSIAELFTSTSSIIGEIIECVEVPLFKSGSPTGTANIAVLDINNGIVYKFGDIDVSTLTLSTEYYTFCPSIDDPDVPSYTIQANDRIGIRWTTGFSNSTNFIRTVADTGDPFDGANSIRSNFITSWTQTAGQDMNMRIFTLEDVPNNVQVSGIGGIYSYENNLYGFTEYPKILFGIIGSILMLAGALIWKQVED